LTQNRSETEQKSVPKRGCACQHPPLCKRTNNWWCSKAPLVQYNMYWRSEGPGQVW